VEATFHQDLELYYEFTSITGTTVLYCSAGVGVLFCIFWWCESVCMYVYVCVRYEYVCVYVYVSMYVCAVSMCML
jgi:hypothetical protein